MVALALRLHQASEEIGAPSKNSSRLDTMVSSAAAPAAARRPRRLRQHPAVELEDRTFAVEQHQRRSGHRGAGTVARHRRRAGLSRSSDECGSFCRRFRDSQPVACAAAMTPAPIPTDVWAATPGALRLWRAVGRAHVGHLRPGLRPASAGSPRHRLGQAQPRLRPSPLAPCAALVRGRAAVALVAAAALAVALSLYRARPDADP